MFKPATKVIGIVGCPDCHAAAQGWGHWDEHNKENTFERNREVEDAFYDLGQEKYTVKVDGDGAPADRRLVVNDDDFHGIWKEVHKAREGVCGICCAPLTGESFRMQLVRKPKPVCRCCGK